MNDKTPVRRLIEMMKEQSTKGPDRALVLLLEQYESVLPELDGYFHKAFRQTDVTDSGKIDMEIWHLVGRSILFWDCFGAIVPKESQ